MSGVFFCCRGFETTIFLRYLQKAGPMSLLEWRRAMNQQQKEHITKLRTQGISYGRIAKTLGVSVNTVKSFCRRQKDPRQIPASTPEKKLAQNQNRICPNCAAMLLQKPGHRQKRFCSEHCRRSWWAAHPEEAKKETWRSATCCQCGKCFSYYRNRKRKYCSQRCYQQYRIEIGGGARV